MSDASSFTKLVPGFDFMQSLVKNAGAALPGIGQWVAPTLDPAELDKRIEELRTVQFWLEQNGRMLGATIQALEVQRMTLSTLQTMNVQMDDLRESMQIRMPTAPAPAPARHATPEPPPVPQATAPTEPEPTSEGSGAATSAKPVGVVDPMQWWGALTKQFAELATTAMKDTGGEAARAMAGALAKPTPATAVKTPVAKTARKAAPRKSAAPRR
jgi:hypothetical protein